MHDTPVRFRLADGEEYAFMPMTLGRWEQFCSWMNRCSDRAQDEPVDFADMMKTANTLQGMVWIATECIILPPDRRNSKTVRDLIGTLERLADIVLVVIASPEAEGKAVEAEVGST